MIKRLMASLLLFLTVFCFVMPSYASANIFSKNTAAGKKIALTFDDGPHPIFTPKILEILERYGIRATFFVIGQNIENYPDAAKLLFASNCEIGNHTYSHKNISKMSESELVCEMERTECAIKNLCNREVTLFRPPEGSCGRYLENVSAAKGYRIILWSVDTMDWAHTPSGRISSEVLENVRGGDIILMHDYISGKNTTLDALEQIIPALINEGYEFVTVSELISG